VHTHFREVHAFRNLFQNRAERQLVPGMLGVGRPFRSSDGLAYDFEQIVR
jgi:hypothetical protein